MLPVKSMKKDDGWAVWESGSQAAAPRQLPASLVLTAVQLTIPRLSHNFVTERTVRQILLNHSRHARAPQTHSACVKRAKPKLDELSSHPTLESTVLLFYLETGSHLAAQTGLGLMQSQSWTQTSSNPPASAFQRLSLQEGVSDVC